MVTQRSQFTSPKSHSKKLDGPGFECVFWYESFKEALSYLGLGFQYMFKNVERTVPTSFIDYAKALDCVDRNKLWKIHKEMRIPDHLTCLLRNLYASQEATVKTRHRTMDWFQIGKGVHQGCILSPCLFNLYAEYIIWNPGLDKAPAVIKTAGRNINNLRYANDTSLMAESEEELNSLLMKVREEWKSWFKTQHSKN